MIRYACLPNRAARWPFPHFVADGVIPREDARVFARVVGEFAHQRLGCAVPDPQVALRSESDQFYIYDNALERKRAFDRIDGMPWPIADLLREMNEPAFLLRLETAFGIEGLIPDPYLRGGGIHAIPPGGHLDIHVDFNIHPKLGLHRRLNVLLYLNENWDTQAGALELWTAQPAPELPEGVRPGECARRVRPELGRLVAFETSEHSFHGHPVPTPPDRWRYSLSAYYYTAAPPPGGAAESHSTRFYGIRGEQDPEREAMRAQRAKARLSSNVGGGRA